MDVGVFRGTMMAITAGCVALIVAKCAGAFDKPTAQAVPAQKVATVLPNAWEEMTRKAYPKEFAKMGDAGMKRVNVLGPQLVQRAAESPECDAVEIVILSLDRSTKANPAFIVDCRNRKRFIMTEADLSGAGPASLQSKMNKSDAEYSTQCSQAIRSQLKNPSSYDRHITSNNVQRAQTGNVVVSFNFTAKNDLGAELDHKARCVFTPDGQMEASIDR